MRVLGIETSCDETGVAIYDSERGLLGDALYSQIELHQQYGGVVPELASRDHVRKTLPLIREVLEKSACTLQDLDGLAYTAGPGLAGALLVGASIGRSLGMTLGIPTIGVHHMKAIYWLLFWKKTGRHFLLSRFLCPVDIPSWSKCPKLAVTH